MWRGLYTAATGMIAEGVRTDTIANNLANANTTGYKRDDAVVAEFEPMLLRRIDDKSGEVNDVTSFKGFSINKGLPVVGHLGLGAKVDEISTDHAQGALQTTGNQLDMAIAGDGYFEVRTPQVVRYTRDGAFYRAADGRLVNTSGYDVLDTAGRNIIIPEENTVITVRPDGIILADDAEIGQLALVDFDNPRMSMLKEGNNLYRLQDPAPRARTAAGSIQQGVLERSNTNIVGEMVNLIASYRSYEASSKAVTTQDTLLDHAVNEVGRGT